MPIAISYEIICALERRPPSSAYLLFDDQPASTMPYTPSDEIARMKRNPIGRSATTMSMRAPRRGQRRAERNHRPRHHRRNEREHRREDEERPCSRAPGYVSSFMMFLRPSATGCSSPRGPTRFGPCRSWIHAEILPLGEREHRDADHVDREDDEHLHDGRDEPRRRCVGGSLRIGRLAAASSDERRSRGRSRGCRARDRHARAGRARRSSCPANAGCAAASAANTSLGEQ